MDPKRIILLMAERLYEDMKAVTMQNPTQIVDDDGARAYNSLLARVRREFHFVDIVSDFPDWSPRTIKYKDAMVVTGQLHAMLQAVMEKQQPVPSRALSAPTSAGPRPMGPNPISAPTGAVRRPMPAGAPNDSQFPGMDVNAPAPPPKPSPTPTPSASADQDLYGKTSAPRRNEDGTIPFSLD